MADSRRDRHEKREENRRSREERDRQHRTNDRRGSPKARTRHRSRSRSPKHMYISIYCPLIYFIRSPPTAKDQSSPKPAVNKEEPNFGYSGKLAAETNTFKVTQLIFV